MTTITNFLNSNFHTNSVNQFAAELPIWVVSGDQNNKIHSLKQYLIEQYTQNNTKNNINKCLVHVDLGIHNFRKSCQTEQHISLQQNLSVAIISQNYFLISLCSKFRSLPHSLSTLITQLRALPKTLQQHFPKLTSFSLLIQGLELISNDMDLHIYLESFINSLTSFQSLYGQISIFKYGKSLKNQHQFALERISTCLTEIEKFQNGDKWLVNSTVRRYTGFSNQQKYTIQIIKNRAKVQKYVPIQQQNSSQKQFLSQISFVVKKGDNSAKDESIKHMIYPHLRMQQQKKQCGQCDCETGNDDEGLIILDDEQEDDDDIDV